MSGRLPSIIFKEHELAAFWNSPLLDSRLKFIIYALAGFTIEEFGKAVTITSIYRKGDASIHGYWRAIDIRSFIYEEEEIISIIKFLNGGIIYGKEPFKTALYHNVGQGPHIHIQVSHNTYTVVQKV